jgi:hypothetical protein
MLRAFLQALYLREGRSIVTETPAQATLLHTLSEEVG